jgi:hypothetical protein
MTIWYIKCAFDTFFGTMYQEKSGNPATGSVCLEESVDRDQEFFNQIPGTHTLANFPKDYLP